MKIVCTPFMALLLATASSVHGAEEKKKGGVTKAQGPPPFFLQDPTDSLCLGGDSFKRCSIDTLFFVVGSPGEYFQNYLKRKELR